MWFLKLFAVIALVLIIALKFGPQLLGATWDIGEERDKLTDEATLAAQRSYETEAGSKIRVTARCHKSLGSRVPVGLLPPGADMAFIEFEFLDSTEALEQQRGGVSASYRLDASGVKIQKNDSKYNNVATLNFFRDADLGALTYFTGASTPAQLVAAKTLRVELPVVGKEPANIEVDLLGLQDFFRLCPMEPPPSTPESCRMFREQMKQLVLSDSGLAGVIVNVPERLLDEASRERYASMTAGECTDATPGVIAELEAYGHTKWALMMQKAAEEATVAAEQCRDKRVNGELKTHADSAQCSNPYITAAFTKIGYPYMDLVKEVTDKRLEEAQKLDKSLLGGTEDQTEFAKLAFDITEQERKRISAQASPPSTEAIASPSATPPEAGTTQAPVAPAPAVPSINCEAPIKPIIDVLVCSSPQLVSTDAEINAAYYQLRHSLAPDAAAFLKEYQKDWLAKRGENCGLKLGDIGDEESARLVSCLQDLYTNRLNALQAQLRGAQ